MRINYRKHCSFNYEIRELYYLKRKVSYSKDYTEKEKFNLIRSIEMKIIVDWNEIKARNNFQNGIFLIDERII